MTIRTTLLALMATAAMTSIAFCDELATPAATALQDYQKAGQLDPLPAGQGSLYRVSWRSNPRTASAYEALAGTGVYYKHISANEHVMKEMAKAGVRRLRLAPHHTMYIHKDWTGPSEPELTNLQGEFKGCKAAGIRPCVAFIHIPIMGTNEDGQKWVKDTWKNTIMPWGAPGSKEYEAYFEKTYLGLLAVLKSAREAGFTESGSYEIEMGQNLWWGFPALKPCPTMTLEQLQPGGLVYEFEKALIARARKDGYAEPVFLNGQSHHYFEQTTPKEDIPGTAGRAFSVYHVGGGVTGKGFTGSDDWPRREALTFAEGTPPDGLALCKPESWMADFSRRDNLINHIKAVQHPIAITSLGMVPSEIPGLMAHLEEKGPNIREKRDGVDGWAIKSRALARSYAFWLNQGAAFVLIHAAYEGANDEMSHALIPDFGKNPESFTWEKSKPLATLKSFREPLEGATKLDKLTDLKFKYALAEDRELIARSEKGGPLMASDAVAILPFQVSEKKFAVACYVVTPDISKVMQPTTMTLQVDKKIAGDVTTLRPLTGAKGKATAAGEGAAATYIFPITDDVTWVVFDIE